MPKQRITKEMVVDAAFGIARSEGMEQVLVKNIAKKIIYHTNIKNSMKII